MVRVNFSGEQPNDRSRDGSGSSGQSHGQPQGQPQGGQQGMIVPIGKYKGQPVEVLAGDPQYVEWLVAQPNIKQQHAHFYNVIINNLCEPNETPEHNAIHVRFLSEKFRRAFCLAAASNATRDRLRRINELIADEIVETATDDQSRAFDIALYNLSCSAQLVSRKLTRILATSIGDGQLRVSVDCVVSIRDGWIGGKRETVERPLSWQFDFDTRGYPISTYELVVESASGVDVEFSLIILGKRFPIRIEIKPSVGDDFPAVLRQMKRSKANYLYVRSFGSASVSRDDFVKFFRSQEIRVIFEEEVEPFIDESFPEVDLESICQLVQREFPS